MAKESVNAMIGLRAKDEGHVYHVKTSNDPADGLGAWAKRYVSYEGGATTDYIFATELLSNKSMRPIHDMIMATEHTRVAQLLFCINTLKIPQRCIKCIKTDCVVLKGFPKKRKAELMNLATVTFKDLPTLRSRVYCCFWDSLVMMQGSDSSAEVFRLGAGKPLQGLTTPWREASRFTGGRELQNSTEARISDVLLLRTSKILGEICPKRRPCRP